MLQTITKVGSDDAGPSRVRGPEPLTHRISGETTSIDWRGQPVFLLDRGCMARFRATPHTNHWIGTALNPVNLTWEPELAPDATISDVSIRTVPRGIRLIIAGTKPGLNHAPFRTHVTASVRPGATGVSYAIRSTLELRGRMTLPAGRKPWGVQFLDLWFDAMFWPQRDGHARELYSWLVLGGADGSLRKTPKLHVFPSLDGQAYRTLYHAVGRGDTYALIDAAQPGYRVAFKRLSAPAKIEICWWAWDAHLFLRPGPQARRAEYEIVIDPVEPAAGRAMADLATTIRFAQQPEYQLPVFYRDQVNTFQKLVDRCDEWTWEPHSSDCRLDRKMGYDDHCSITILKDTPGRTAWYSRALGDDYFDHRPLTGRYRLTAQVRTRRLAGRARIAIFCCNGPETYFGEEPGGVAIHSTSLTGTCGWTLLELDFLSDGYKRFKIVLEQEGPGQSWFDNVELTTLDYETASGDGDPPPPDGRISRPNLIAPACFHTFSRRYIASPHASRKPMDSVILRKILAREYDFIDFGSSSGGSIDYCMRRFAARRGVGVDVGRTEVEAIRAKGFDALEGDVLKFECRPGCVRFVSMMDFLEHLPDAACVEQALATARRIARDFLFIRHPSFDDEHYLSAIGLKQYWTDWSGHTAKITLAQFTQMFARLGLLSYSFSFRKPAVDSSDSVMLPLAAPPDQHHYDAALHGPKPHVVFPRPLYGQIDIVVALRAFEPEDWVRVSQPFD